MRMLQFSQGTLKTPSYLQTLLPPEAVKPLVHPTVRHQMIHSRQQQLAPGAKKSLLMHCRRMTL